MKTFLDYDLCGFIQGSLGVSVNTDCMTILMYMHMPGWGCQNWGEVSFIAS